MRSYLNLSSLAPFKVIVKQHALFRSLLLSCSLTTEAIISLLILLMIIAVVVFCVVFWPRMRIVRIQKQTFPDLCQQTCPELKWPAGLKFSRSPSSNYLAGFLAKNA